jgi:hypothetical protein
MLPLTRAHVWMVVRHATVFGPARLLAASVLQSVESASFSDPRIFTYDAGSWPHLCIRTSGCGTSSTFRTTRGIINKSGLDHAMGSVFVRLGLRTSNHKVELTRSLPRHLMLIQPLSLALLNTQDFLDTNYNVDDHVSPCDARHCADGNPRCTSPTRTRMNINSFSSICAIGWVFVRLRCAFAPALPGPIRAAFQIDLI